MAELLTWLEATSLSTWTRESPSLWAYPTILTAHTIGLAIVVGLSAVVNLRLLGFAPRVPLPALAGVFGLMSAAFALNALTGWLLFMADATTKGRQPVLYIKLTLIGLALWCTWRTRGVVLRRTEHDATRASTGDAERGVALASLILWAAAIAAGRLMAYV